MQKINSICKYVHIMDAYEKLPEALYSGTVYNILYIRASVAQWIEQRFPEPCAVGSSPSRCAYLRIFERKCAYYAV